jgi:hypothetical protein
MASFLLLNPAFCQCPCLFWILGGAFVAFYFPKLFFLSTAVSESKIPETSAHVKKPQKWDALSRKAGSFLHREACFFI